MAKHDRFIGSPAREGPDTPHQRAEVVAALRAGLISRDDAIDDYGLTPEEIAAWERTFDSLGLRRKLSRQV